MKAYILNARQNDDDSLTMKVALGDNLSENNVDLNFPEEDLEFLIGFFSRCIYDRRNSVDKK